MKRAKGKKKNNNISSIVILAVFAIAVLAFFVYLSNKPQNKSEKEPEITAVQNLLLKDLSKTYPATPKEVVKLYSDITKCFYAEDYTEEELYELVKMSHTLFDADLAKLNPLDLYYSSLQTEIQNYKDRNQVISAYSVASSSVDIENAKFEKDGHTCTKVYVDYTMRIGTVITTVHEVFVLRKDETGYWRIYGWDQVN